MALVVAYMSLVVTIEENTFQFINSCSTNQQRSPETRHLLSV